VAESRCCFHAWLASHKATRALPAPTAWARSGYRRLEGRGICLRLASNTRGTKRLGMAGTAAWALEKELRGHTAGVTGCAWSPDGSKLVSAACSVCMTQPKDTALNCGCVHIYLTFVSFDLLSELVL